MVYVVLILFVVVMVLGGIQVKKVRDREKAEEAKNEGCGGGCAGCANKAMCHSDEKYKK